MKTILYLHAGAELYGSDKVLLQLVNGLDKLKFRPIVVLPENGPLVDKLKEANIQTEIVSYPILRRKYFNLAGIFKYVIGYFKAGKTLAKIAKKYQVDLIHVNTLAVLEGITLKKRIKKPLVWHVHEIIENPKFMWKLTAYLSAKYADKIVVVSNATGNHLKKAGYAKKNQIVTIYNGIDIPTNSDNSDFRSEYNIPKDAFVFGHIGRINAWKGQEDFLKAGLKLLVDHPNVHLLFSGNAYKGEEWREEKLKREILDSGYEKRIHFLGFKKDISRVYRTINILISTSNGQETFSLVVGESMSFGKPTIAYKSPGPNEIIIDNYDGFLVAPGDQKELVNKMIFLEQHSKHLHAMGLNAKKDITEKFSKKSFLENFSRIYEIIVNG